jgi:hypothetical protein
MAQWNRANQNQQIFLAGAVGVTAALITWSRPYCSSHTADSVLAAIISVTKVTWYYWGQNRLGNLLPFLTSWISNVESNFMAQVLLRTTLASLTPLLVIKLLKPQAPTIFCFGACMLTLFITSKPQLEGFIHPYWNDANPYGASIALLLGSITISDRFASDITRGGRLLAAVISFVLMVIATWVNLSLVILAAPLFFLMALALRSPRYTILFLMSLSAYFLIDADAAHVGGRNYKILEPSLQNLENAVTAIFEAIRTREAVISLALLVIGLAARMFFDRKLAVDRRVLVSSFDLMVAIVIVSAILAALTTASVEWVVMNGEPVRYFSLPIVLIISAMSVMTADAIWRLVPLDGRLQAAAGVGLLGLGISAVAGATLPLDSRCPLFANPTRDAAAEIAEKARSFKVALVAGDYWTTWPAVFEILRGRHGQKAFGLAARGDAARDLIRTTLHTEKPVGLVCLENDLDQCRQDFVRTVGEDEYYGIPLANAMAVVEEGYLEKSKLLFRVISLNTFAVNDRAVLCAFNKCISERALSPSFRIDFKTGGNGALFTDDRWFGPEPWGTWIAGDAAGIKFMLESPHDLQFSILVRPFLSSRAPKQSVWVDANGCRVGSARFDVAQNLLVDTISGAIPVSCFDSDGRVVLRIQTDRASTPNEMGINADTRRIGIGVEEIVIRKSTF